MLQRKKLRLAAALGIFVMLCALALAEALRADSVEYSFTSQLSGGIVLHKTHFHSC